MFQNSLETIIERQWLNYNVTKYFFQPLDTHNEENLTSSKSEKFKNSFVVRTKSSKKAQYFPLFNPKEEKYIFGEIEDDNDIPIPEIRITEEEFANSINSKNLLESSEQNDLGFNIAMQKGQFSSVPERYFLMLAKENPIMNGNFSYGFAICKNLKSGKLPFQIGMVFCYQNC